MNLDTYLFLLLSLAYDAVRKRPIEKIREYGDEVKCQDRHLVWGEVRVTWDLNVFKSFRQAADQFFLF